MTHLNKKRAGDENIGKLIMFSITIIIAVGLVGLITFFYNQSRENAVAGSVLGSSASSNAEIEAVVLNTADGHTAGDCTGTDFKYDAISGVYTLTDAADQEGCADSLRTLSKVVDNVTPTNGSGAASAADVTYKMK